MKKLLLILFLFSSPWAVTMGQQHDGNIYIKQAAEGNNTGFDALTDEELWGYFSAPSLISGLQQSAAEATQIARISITGDQNMAELTQSGIDILGAININGSENNVSLSQTGTSLISILNVRGSFNEMDVEQQGQALQNYIEVNGNGINFNVLQNNAGLIYSQDGSIPITIERTGQTVPLIITNN